MLPARKRKRSGNGRNTRKFCRKQNFKKKKKKKRYKYNKFCLKAELKKRKEYKKVLPKAEL